ncbi:MAG: adenylate kinase [Leptolyngbya foveolarum]|uniref:Adenylate kinase n=1 Tax=Leptolyngbya foveolarum TaxID=47253 RepID=A0A2W4UNI0_9CYAN|nr:MAG: adenylate kinase [Leptolyngbya foveolarum]
MTRLIFLGPPGAGKGTQAKALSGMCNVPHISTGDILRAAVKAETELGQKAEGYMSAGELVPDDLILDLIRERLSENDTATGWLLDGFPRNVEQAEFLNKLLAEINQTCDVVINLEVPDDELVTRMLSRGRADDKEAVIRNRLEVYREQTEPLIDLYKGSGQLRSVDGNQEMQRVTEALQQFVQCEVNAKGVEA